MAINSIIELILI